MVRIEQNFLVTKSEKIYRLDKSTATLQKLRPIYMEDVLTTPAWLDPEIYARLPVELLIIIMDMVVESLWVNRQFEFIHPTITTSKYFLDRYYQRYVHQIYAMIPHERSMRQSRRLAKIIITINSIYNTLLLPQGDNSTYIMSFEYTYGAMPIPGGIPNPWDFFSHDAQRDHDTCSLDLHSTEKPIILTLDPGPWSTFQTGNRMCDVAKMDGLFHECDDTFHASSFQQPFVILRHHESDGATMHKFESIASSDVWDKFNTLLRKCLGKLSGVYYVVADSPLYINYEGEDEDNDYENGDPRFIVAEI